MRNFRTLMSCRKYSWSVRLYNKWEILGHWQAAGSVTGFTICHTWNTGTIMSCDCFWDTQLWGMLVHCHTAASAVGCTEEIMTGISSAIFYVVGIIVRCVPYVGCHQDIKSQQSNYVCFELTFRKTVSAYANAQKSNQPLYRVRQNGLPYFKG